MFPDRIASAHLGLGAGSWRRVDGHEGIRWTSTVQNRPARIHPNGGPDRSIVDSGVTAGVHEDGGDGRGPAGLRVWLCTAIRPLACSMTTRVLSADCSCSTSGRRPVVAQSRRRRRTPSAICYSVSQPCRSHRHGAAASAVHERRRSHTFGGVDEPRGHRSVARCSRLCLEPPAIGRDLSTMSVESGSLEAAGRCSCRRVAGDVSLSWRQTARRPRRTSGLLRQ